MALQDWVGWGEALLEGDCLVTDRATCLVILEVASGEQEEEASLDKARKLRRVVDCSTQEALEGEREEHCFRRQLLRVSVN